MRIPFRTSVPLVHTGIILLGMLVGSVNPQIAPPIPSGAEILYVDVTHDSGVYHVTSVAHFTAPLASVYAVLTDYERLTRISEIVVESRLLDPAEDDGSLRLHTLLRGCVAFFCRTVVRVEPELSDLRDGFTEWRFYPLEDGGTRVDLRMQVVPDFWIPPLIGPPAMRRRLLQDGTDAVERIEELALKALDPRPAARNLDLRGG